MAKRRPPETLGDFLETVIAERRFVAWCRAAKIQPSTVAGLIDGKTAPRRATVLALAKALGRTPDEIRAAIEAGRG